MSTFEERAASVGKSLKTSRGAIAEVRASVALKGVLAIVLAHGNHMNHGTARDNAVGFKV
jgi:hypothetical protein